MITSGFPATEIEPVVSEGLTARRACGITWDMRYPQGGALTAERQQFRKELRLQASERFAQGEAGSTIDRDLPVSELFPSSV
ncbi:hypothetical protein GCM10009716_49080 [Streptomyces sodiiphilus]|uniref:Uncharacterized protein n=1 Tax=Streptomyces sodiiphilus TaxID=226217 RepID=A0ABP5B8G9_9ACTN